MIMTLRKRMTVATTALIASLLLLAGTSLYGLYGISSNLDGVLEEYEEIRVIEALDIHVAEARGNLSAQEPNLPVVKDDLGNAIRQLELFVELQESDEDDLRHQGQEAKPANALIASLNVLIEQLDQAEGHILPKLKQEQLIVSMNTVLSDLDELIVQIDSAVQVARHSAQRKLRKTILVTMVVSVMIVLFGVLTGVGQYRSVIGPLRQLREGVRRTAHGDLGQEMNVQGDQEFVDLAEEFNRMTRQLQGFYQDLEQRVAAKSKQLVRSERLASVGFLAAGVAHEINNPLNIISGYSEISLKQLRGTLDETMVGKLIESQQIVRDESFRCKQIIEKLLSLCHMSEASRQVLNLADIADEVASMMKGLNKLKGRKLNLCFDPGISLTVMANEAEMKQVLLNLAVNAIESVDTQNGEVCIRGVKNNRWVEICIEDNGHGMCQETLARIFEPFFTDKRSKVEHGIGLGLSIVHAIIEAHGGRIEAHSDGPGKGSRFTIIMPVAQQESFNDKTVSI